MKQNFKRIKKSTLSDSIINQILQMISEGELLPGQKLPSERALAEILAVSRPSIREAMRSLQTLGLVDIRTGDGTYLNEDIQNLSDFKIKHILKKYSILELNEARRLLEGEIAALAAQRATKENKELIKETFQETLKHLNDPESFLKADFDYHMAIAEAAQNKYLAEMLHTTRDLMIEANQDVVRDPDQNKIINQHHRKIMVAIVEGEVDQARSFMLNHLEYVINVIKEIYSVK